VTPTLFNVHTTSHKLRRERVIIKVERLESLRNYSFKWIPPFMYLQGGILHEPHCLFRGACFLLDRRSLVLGLLDRDHLKPSWATLGKTDQSLKAFLGYLGKDGSILTGEAQGEVGGCSKLSIGTKRSTKGKRRKKYKCEKEKMETV
jgi:hypothetical protein